MQRWTFEHDSMLPVLGWRLAAAFCFLVQAAHGQDLGYSNNHDLAEQLQRLSTAHREIVRLKSVAKTRAKIDLWLVELGSGADDERKRRPALLLVAGIEGNDLAGTACSLAWIERLAQGYENDKTLRKVLDSTTIYVFPRVNPDAAEQFFAKPKTESIMNSLPADDDHDGLVDEDGPDDLNGDGLISWMRIEDPEGEYVQDPAEPRLLIKADKAKGEKGRWRHLVEGRDNDQDEAWNEDGRGGVHFNRNFPFGYKFFGSGAGSHPVSEVETRALADFVVEHPNVGIVFTFGAADNLVQTPKAEAPKRPPTHIQEADLPYYRELGKAYRETFELNKELQGSAEPGTFSDWLYFHRGRLSLAARPWTPAMQLERTKAKPSKEAAKGAQDKGAAEPKPDAVKSEKTEPEKPTGEKNPDPKAKPQPDTRNEEERAFLKWIDENAPEAFLPWQAFDHPDFPGRKVEIGGFAPFAKANPPKKPLNEIAQKHGTFFTELAGRLPRITVRKAEAKDLGESVYELTIQVENIGYLPTALAQGVATREVLPTRVILDVEQNNILAGERISTLGPIDGSGGMTEVRCTLRAKGRNEIGVEVISALGGVVKTSIRLLERNERWR